MNINDDTLSAFLDGELPENQMEAVRERLAEQPELAERLAELSAVDGTLRQHYGAIDDRPLPEAVQRMLSSADDQPDGEQKGASRGQVIEFPLWRRARQALSQHTAVAATVALAVGFGLAHLSGDFGTDDGRQWQAVAGSLETLPSGANRTLEDGSEIAPRITFVNRNGDYCRQYRVVGAERMTENIACRTGDSSSDWELMASVRLPAVEPGSYQTASGGSLLDSTLDEMMAGDVIDPSREQALIEQNWQNPKDD